jgi:hypothetical protein
MKTRTMKLWYILIASLLVFACEKPAPVGPDQPGKPTPPEEETPTAYQISLKAESEFYEVEFPESAQAGEIVTVRVNPVENVFVDAVRYNSLRATAVEGEENTFEFEMPEKKVTLSVNTSSTVTVLPSSYFSGSADAEIAAAGDLVTVSFIVNNIEDIVSTAMVNGTIECELVGMDLGEYIFTFEMPEGPAVVEGFTSVEYHEIYREWDENCVIYMLDCINHQGTPEEFCSQKPEGIVHFIYKWDLGYDVTCTVTGQKTGKDYTREVFWSLAADNHLYQDCWAFYMPNEPVLIKAVSKEKSVYVGADFIGNYSGYWITFGENNIYTSSEPSMSIEFCESSAYFVNSTDENAYDFSGLYAVNEKAFAGDRETSRGDFALRGEFLEGDFAFAIIDNLLFDNVDHRRFYLTAKDGFDFVSATDKSNGGRFLLEADQNGQKTWYFVERDNQSIKKAEVTFISGNSIGQTCEAMVDVIGGMEFNKTDRFRYSYENGGTPVFTYSGKEVGTYTSDKGETLELDGFGNATYNGVAGTYTIEAGLVTYTDATGNQTKFNINMNDKTFTVIVESTGIKLDPVYSTTTAWISVDGQPSETGMITVAFDANYGATATKEGYAFIQINYMETGKVKEMIGASCPYYTDETNRTVTISNVLQGNGGWGTTKKDIVLNISEDGKTLTFVDEAIFSTVSPYIFCYGQEWAPIYSETK